MKRTNVAGVALALACAVGLGCGDDDGGSDAGGPRDSGGGTDSGGGVDADGAERVTFEFRFVEIGADDARTPLEGVHASMINGDGTRVEAMSDAAGAATFVIGNVPPFTGVGAKEGYTITSQTGSEAELRGDAEGVIEVPLFPVAPPADNVRAQVSATGVPAGGRFCAGVGEFYGSCVDAGGTITLMVPVTAATDRATGYALDDTGAIVDFAEATYTVDGTDRSATLAFDGTPAVAPMTRAITIEMPADAMSPYRTGGLYTGPMAISPVVAMESGTYLTLGGVGMLTRAGDGASYTGTLTWFPTAGEEPLWAMALYSGPEAGELVFRWFAGEPAGSTLDFMDVARITAPAADAAYADAELAWTAPTGATFYGLFLFNNAGRAVWGHRTTEHEGVRLPALPATYDTSVSFPFAGANGTARVRSFSGTIPPDTMLAEPYRVDGQLSVGPAHPITF